MKTWAVDKTNLFSGDFVELHARGLAYEEAVEIADSKNDNDDLESQFFWMVKKEPESE